MENQFVEVKVRMKRETYEKVESITRYINKRNQLVNNEKQYRIGTVEDFIIGATIRDIERIETYNHLITHRGDISLADGRYELKNRLKEVLAEKGMKQLDLCDLTGIDRSTISTIVNNRSQPTSDILLRIWVALDFYPLDQIFYREKPL